MNPRVSLFIVVLLAVTTASAQVATPPQPPASPANSADGYIVTFRPGTSLADRAASVARAGALLRFNYTIIDAAAVRVPNVNALAALQRDMSVVGIFPDREIRAIQSPPIEGWKKPGGGGDGGGSQVVPEGVKRVGVALSGSDGTGIGVLIADTGIDLNHADLTANLAVQRVDAFGGN